MVFQSKLLLAKRLHDVYIYGILLDLDAQNTISFSSSACDVVDCLLVMRNHRKVGLSETYVQILCPD